MSEFWRRRVIDRLQRGASLDQIDRELAHVRGISDDERAALWLLAWGEQQRATPISGRFPCRQGGLAIAADTRWPVRSSGVDPITAALELAQAETEMDVAVLGEIYDGCEVVRFVAGHGSFGLAPGASMPIEDTYCHRLLTGRLSNVVPDAHANDHLRDLQITRDAGIGAYIGVPLATLDARLYVLCCLAHEQRPQLGERDVLFLRGLGETIVAELEKRRTHHADGSDLTPATEDPSYRAR
jgi:GAF domain-containing protein